eukprot:40777_6
MACAPMAISRSSQLSAPWRRVVTVMMLDECASSPCENGATCTDSTDASVTSSPCLQLFMCSRL